jgi:hypothetical protein
MTNIQPFLSEDNVSDLLWLVINYGHNLTEVADYIDEKDVAKLTETLEAMLDCMG